MYHIELGKTGLSVPTIAVGCMRINQMNEKEASAFVETCLENGANFFDHADIYGSGDSERVFGKAIAGMRDKVLIQTKCGIDRHKHTFDFSYDYIVNAVNGSLQRLGTDHIDVLLLHRPDALMEPEEVARAFRDLKEAGKVSHFGVSNQNPYQMQLLQKAMDMPICANQLQLSIMHTPMIQAGINVNMTNESGINRDGGVLDFCRLNDITIQPWSPMQFGFIEGCFVDNDKFPEINRAMQEIADRYSVSKTTIAIAWLLRHPAKMMPITGTTNLSRLRDSFKATEIRLTHEEWYALYRAAGNVLP